MLLFPNSYTAGWQSNFPATPSTSTFTTVTANALANTKGSYSQLIAATTYDSFGFWLAVYATQVAATNTSVLVDIALGAAASEVDILSNFMAAARAASIANGGPYWVFIPLFIPAGAMVSARCQAVTGADTVAVGISTVSGRSQVNGPIFTACDTYGANTANSGGTSHTPGNSGAESTDATIGTATRDYGAVLLGLGTVGTVLSNLAYHWELTGGTNTLAEWVSYTHTVEAILGPYPAVPIGVRVANGTAMQVQAECSGTGEAHDVAFYCFY